MELFVAQQANSILSSNGFVAPNVSTVPHYSPFRYPGGKSWMYPFIRLWIKSQHKRSKLFAEPFAGGAHVGLAVAIENLADQVMLVELDENVAAVWNTIINGNHECLIDRIMDFNLTKANLETVFNQDNSSSNEHAFAVILHNRTSRGGITASGSGLLKKGENNKGILSRWYPQTLKRRIEKIAECKGRIKFIRGDGLDLIKQTANRKDTIFFIDPPYTQAGRRLYKHSDVDPNTVFELMSSVEGDFLITYDKTEEILALVQSYELQSAQILMSTTHHEKKYELVIGRDLSWLTASD